MRSDAGSPRLHEVAHRLAQERGEPCAPDCSFCESSADHLPPEEGRQGGASRRPAVGQPAAELEPVARHDGGCTCTRCTGFLPSNEHGLERRFKAGNELSVRHGAFSVVKLEPRAVAIADEIREIVPASSPSDEPTIRLAALVLARVEAANEWLAEHGIFREGGKGEPQPVLKALSTWENTAARLLDRLGCSPLSRGQLGLSLVRAQNESVVVRMQRLHEAAEEGEAS